MKNEQPQISKRDVIRILRDAGAKNPEIAYHSVCLAIAKGAEPCALIETVKRNATPRLFWPD